MRRKIIALLLAVLMIMSAACLSACGSDNDTPQNEISGGTQEDPWLVGAGVDKSSVQVFIADGSLWVDGSGTMMDFEDEASRPWNDVIAEVGDISVFGEVSAIGKNAFKGAGTKNGSLDVGFYSPIEVIGESAFEGCGFTDANIVTIPDTVTEIKNRAFADSGIKTVYFDGVPAIAEDAFAGAEAEFFVRSGSAWDESNMLPYGGEISYRLLYAFNYVEDYGTEDVTGEGTLYIPEGESYDYNAEDYVAEEGYHFVKYELVSGSLVIENPENPVLTIVLEDDVSVRIVYAAD